MKKIGKRVLYFGIAIILSVLLYVPAFARDKERETVKVAYFDLGNYYQVNSNGKVKSYDSAWLDMISQYTGLTFEYVNCGTWDKALSMLENHEIDLIGTMQWTQEREDKYAICDTNYGYTIAELAAAEDSNLIYEDYASIQNATVGYIEGYVVYHQLEKLMKEKNLIFQMKSFRTQKELDDALDTGKIDLVAANAHAIHDNWKIIEKFAYAPFYFASWKENSDLTEEISQAIIRINIHQHNFDDDLIKEYFPIMVNSPYNKKELDCINQDKVYHIYLDPRTKPVVYYDAKTNRMQGVLVDVCKELEHTTGLRFDIRPRKEDIHTDSNKDTTVTYRTLYYGTENNASLEMGVTDSILNQNFALYHRIGESYQKEGAYTIAIVKNRDGLLDYLHAEYPQCKLIEYSNPEECMKKLSNRKVDLVFLDTAIAENCMIEDNLNQLTDVPMTEVSFGIALQFHGENAQLLSEIIDKGRKLVSEDIVNESMLNYAMNTTPKVSLQYLLQQHFELVVVWLMVLIIILIICVSLFTYARMMKKERNRMAEINRERTDFFARMSHDMRTPMNGILGMIALSKQSTDLEEIQNNTRKAEQSGQYMLSLINDTLDLQRLESKKLTLEPKPVLTKDFMENILEMIIPTAEQKDILFQVNKKNLRDELYIFIDQMRVKQIFMNILSNAVKFTPKGGTIQADIEVASYENHKAAVRVSISDTGIGMSQSYIEDSLFKPYSQEHNKITGKYAGSGLGLAIVKNLVELMGGSITVKSQVDEGTTFKIYLEIPYLEQKDVAEKVINPVMNMEKIKEILKGRKILLCEDHPLNAEIAKRLLEKMDCEVVIANNGKEGITLYEQSAVNEYDAILMDIRMPVMDGLEAAAAIRDLERTDGKTVPIIAMTANAYDSDRENSEKAGMNAHLAKPIEVNELYQTLAKLIKEK